MTRPTNPHVERSGLRRDPSALADSPAERTTDVPPFLVTCSTPREGVTIPEARLTSDERKANHKVNPSSWIDKVLYRRVAGRWGYLAVFLKRRNGHPTVLLYGPKDSGCSGVPSWMCGLIQAGEGGQSIGTAYNSLLKRPDVQAKYGIQYQRVEGEERVRELERMMTGE